MRRLYLHLIVGLLSVIIWQTWTDDLGRAAPLANAVVPGQVRTDTTFEHIGLTWWIDGDDDLDSTMTLEFRRQGTSLWQPGAPAMRAYPTIYVNDGPLGLNYWAASALFLESGQTYELRLTLSDPDGGGERRTVMATTRTRPQPDLTGRQLHVMPGSGGGDGSSGNPFRGLQAAANAAQAGDIFHIAPGTYSAFEIWASGIEGRPIVFVGPGNGTAIVDGGGTDRGVVTLDGSNQTPGHIIIQGLTIQAGAWGIDAQDTHDIFIHHNHIRDVDFGIYNRRYGGLEFNQTICDNLIEGRTPWPGSGIPLERGIDLRGTGNVVCYNTVRNFGDCISVQPLTGASYGNDVYGNDAAYCVDDGIEIDYNQANVRVWRNRVMNTRRGVSVQPIRGGPAYIFRNEFFNQENVPIKMHNFTTGFFVIHNTGAKHGEGHGDNGQMWRNAVFRNNLFLGTEYAFTFITVADEGFRDLDYNGWGTTRSPTDPYFKWDNVRYDRITDLPPGVEDHGVEAVFADLVNPVLPADWNVAAVPGTRDLRLRAGVAEIDAGTELANFNDGFAIAGAPDLGAFEYGQPLPHYGPRPLTPDLGGSRKQVSRSSVDFGNRVNYTIILQNSGTPLTSTVTMTDTIPAGLTYVPGSLAASLGTVDDSAVPTLSWTGSLADEVLVTITYAVTVTESETRFITNSATFEAGPAGRFTRTARVLVNGQVIHLPLIRKG